MLPIGLGHELKGPIFQKLSVWGQNRGQRESETWLEGVVRLRSHRSLVMGRKEEEWGRKACSPLPGEPLITNDTQKSRIFHLQWSGFSGSYLLMFWVWSVAKLSSFTEREAPSWAGCPSTVLSESPVPASISALTGTAAEHCSMSSTTRKIPALGASSSVQWRILC